MATPVTNVAAPTQFGYVPQTAPSGAEIAGGLANAALQVTGMFTGGGLGGVVGGMGEAAMYSQLMQEQNRIQRETLLFTAQSNASKTQHDTKKGIVGNWRT